MHVVWVLTMTVKGHTMFYMSEATTERVERVPEWTLGWKLKRGLDFAGLSAQEMANELGVHVGTVSRWMNDREPPRRAYVIAWALRCGVPFDWFAENEQWAARDSNSEPMDSSPISTAELKSEYLRNIGRPIEPSRRTGRPRIQAGVA